MAKDIKFDIKLTVDGKEKLVTAATDAKNCVKQLDESHSSAIGLRHTLFDTHDIAYTADFGRAENNKGKLKASLLVIRMGLEPMTPTLKVLCSTS